MKDDPGPGATSETAAWGDVLGLIGEAANMPVSRITLDHAFGELGIDSLRMFQLMLDIENELEAEFDDVAIDLILSSATVAELCQAVERISEAQIHSRST